MEGARRDNAPPPALDAVFAPASSSSRASASSAASARGRGGAPARTSVESAVSSSSSSSASSAAAPEGASPLATGPARHPVILILDETLQRLPWESTPLLRGRAVSRCPSLDYVRAALVARKEKDKGKGVKPTLGKGRGGGGSKPAPLAGPVAAAAAEAAVPSGPGYYLLDPEANLPNTRATLQPALARLNDSSRQWSGTVGEAPGEALLRERLAASSVFVYCGHGSGELFLPREEVAALARAPFAVLMGCSSGRLKAPTPAFEPGGMALSYLAAGAPAVVGNLWDVTDKDIDRFSLALLDRLFFFSEEYEDEAAAAAAGAGSVLEAVAASRAACKLPFLVGAAPVVYGLPLRVVRT